MFWILIALIIGVAIVCDCITECFRHRYKYDTCCCKTCPYRDECLEVCEDE